MGYLEQFAQQSGLFAKVRVSGDIYAQFLNSFMRLTDVKQTALSSCSVLQSEAVLLFAALDYTAEYGEHITVAETARRLNVSMPSVSRSLKAMSEKGFIKRDLDENDRRSVRIIVTTAGEEKLRELLKRIFTVLDTTLEVFSDEELLQMIMLHNRFVDSLIDTLNKRKGE